MDLYELKLNTGYFLMNNEKLGAKLMTKTKDGKVKKGSEN
jgi:hypothetical protein